MGHHETVTVGTALGMLAHMPWYHYALMAVVVIAAGVAVYRQTRRRYWPQHATMAGIARTTAEHIAILATVEFVGLVLIVFVVGAGMLVYHVAIHPMG